ncbi:MAG: extracellular solute-binding protein [Treponema sp.]|nr:extracellular solute-binding protein [Treponema sp.]
MAYNISGDNFGKEEFLMLKTFKVKALAFVGLFFCVAVNAKPKVNLSVWADDGTLNVVSKRLSEFKSFYSKEAAFNFTVIEQPSAYCASDLMANPELAADVFVFADDQIETLIDQQLLLEIPEDIAKKVSDEYNGSSSAAVKTASMDGKLYAFPQLSGNGYFLYYNKKYISADDVGSFEQILKVASQNNKQVAMDLKNGWYLYSFFKAAGLEVYRNNGAKNFCNWNATNTKFKGIDVAKAIIKLASNPAFVSASSEDTLSLIKEGKVVAAVSGAWNANLISEMWGKDYAAVKLPTYNLNGTDLQMYSFAGYKMVGVKAGSDNKEWALKLAEWLSDEKTQLMICQSKGECPVNLNAASNPLVKKSPAIAAMAEQTKYSTTQRIGGSFWNPALVLGVVLSDGKNLSDQEIQSQLDVTVRNIRN